MSFQQLPHTESETGWRQTGYGGGRHPQSFTECHTVHPAHQRLGLEPRQRGTLCVFSLWSDCQSPYCDKVKQDLIDHWKRKESFYLSLAQMCSVMVQHDKNRIWSEEIISLQDFPLAEANKLCIAKMKKLWSCSAGTNVIYTWLSAVLVQY